MILTIDNHRESTHQIALETMFADRKAQFVDFFDWDVPVVDGRFEIDQFDTAGTVYLVAVDTDGRHEGSLRMLPSWQPHLLGQIFPHLCAGGVPTGPTTWESTRLCLPSRHGAGRRRVLRNALISAMADFALARGIEHITGVIPDSFRREVLAMGWRAEPLGPALRIKGGPIGAFRIEVTPDVCERLAWTGTYAGALELARMTVRDDIAIGDLARDGYCVLRGVLDRAVIDALADDLAPSFAATPMCKGVFYGHRTRRFGALLRRSAHAEALVRHPTVLAIAERMLLPWCERIALNLTQAVEIHPGAPPQFPHRDQDMWAGPKGTFEYLVNVMWPIDPFTEANGGTRLWPGSHDDQERADFPEDLAAVPDIAPGDALLFLGSTLHGGGGNRSAASRRGAIVSYCLGWLKPFELQWLVYPPAIARHFSPELAALVGYVQHRPNLGNVEGQCPSILLRDDVPEHLGAVDALRPDQEALAVAFLGGGD